MYSVKEIYYTIQGEGFHSGRPAVFCRFSGCNLWSGREQDRANAICQFCDTDFVGTDGLHGGKYTVDALVTKISSLYPDLSVSPFVVFTGGEPGLQLDEALVTALHEIGFEVAIETNGTVALPHSIDWICVSPKANTDILITKGNELKLVVPQKELHPTDFEALDFEHFYLQPMDSADQSKNTAYAIDYCMKHPQWKLSMQTHKYLGID